MKKHTSLTTQAAAEAHVRQVASGAGRDEVDGLKCSSCMLHIQDGWECACTVCSEHNALCTTCASLNPDSLYMTQHRAHIIKKDITLFDDTWTVRVHA